MLDDGSRIHAEIAADLEAGRRCQAMTVVEMLGLVSWRCEVPGVREGWYGGTIDLLAVDAAGTAHVLDWKTTVGGFPAEARPREALQVAAYSGMLVAGDGGGLVPAAAGLVQCHVARLSADAVAVSTIDVAAAWAEWVELAGRPEPELVERVRRI